MRRSHVKTIFHALINHIVTDNLQPITAAVEYSVRLEVSAETISMDGCTLVTWEYSMRMDISRLSTASRTS